MLSFKNGLAPVKKNGKWGFIDSKNKLILPYRYDGASSFINGMARVRLAELTGMIDKKGKEIIPLQFQHITYLSDYILVNDERAFGLLDKKGNWLLPCMYAKIEMVDSTILRVEINNKFGYYNIISCEFIWKENGVN